jgi:Arc/MetJ family transcription regulator
MPDRSRFGLVTPLFLRQGTMMPNDPVDLTSRGRRSRPWISRSDIHDILRLEERGECMTMVKTPVEIDTEALAVAAEVLGTKTKKDTVNAALREVGQRLVRLRALARLGEMADRGDFDEFLDNKAAYRR